MVDLIAFVAPAECADGGDDGGGAAAPRLLERTVLGGLNSSSTLSSRSSTGTSQLFKSSMADLRVTPLG